MASDARAKANPEGPRTWVAIALFLLFLIYGVDKYFYDIPNFLDDEFEESHTTQLKPRSETLPAATPHYDALQKRLAEEKALSYCQVLGFRIFLHCFFESDWGSARVL